ncbi:MAG: LysR family transcriptional regulator [Alteromonadaceae bacterium]|nr:LysR family transcriptional regulator [Alteromonadaceae bacterium]
MQLPNLKHLQYLLALHQHQHFLRAAQASFVSQSTLSSAILKLEELLGCQLIERDHKAFIFTVQGEEVVKLSRQLLVSANEMVDYAQQQGDPDSGSLRIGCIPTIAPFLLTDLVQKYQQAHPSLSLFLREDTTENLLMMLSKGEIDTAILALPVVQHQFKSKVLGKDVFYVAGDENLINKFKDNFDYQQLPDESIFLLSQEHCLTEHSVSACHIADQSKVNSFSASSIATLVQMTAFHRGITFLPEMAVNKGVGIAEGIAFARMDGAAYREIGLLWRKTSTRQQTFFKLAEILEFIISMKNN